MPSTPRLTVLGFPTTAFTWSPTVASYVIATLQGAMPEGVRKVRWSIDRPSATWRVQVAATPAGLAAIRALVADAKAYAGTLSP